MLDVHFFLRDTATTEIYTLSLHDALPIFLLQYLVERRRVVTQLGKLGYDATRSEERFSRNAETDLVCRLLLEKKNTGLPPTRVEPGCGAGQPFPRAARSRFAHRLASFRSA